MRNFLIFNIVPLELPCYDDVFGPGNVEDVHVGDCNEDMVGYQTAKCTSSGKWQITDSNCVVQVIQNLKARAAVITFPPPFFNKEKLKKISDIYLIYYFFL